MKSNEKYFTKEKYSHYWFVELCKECKEHYGEETFEEAEKLLELEDHYRAREENGFVEDNDIERLIDDIKIPKVWYFCSTSINFNQLFRRKNSPKVQINRRKMQPAKHYCNKKLSLWSIREKLRRKSKKLLDSLKLAMM